VDKHSATSIKRVLDEVIAGWEVLEQVFIVDVVDFDDLVVVIPEQILIQWQPEDGQHVCDTGFLQCFLAAQCEESGQRIRSLELATGVENGEAISAYEPANVQL